MENRKQLIIVRHGKSSWKYESIADIDRHLKERGIHDAYAMAERLKDHQIYPDTIISSPAPRALHTALIFARALNHPLSELYLQDIFYNGDKHDVLEVIGETPEETATLMIFGHNPTFTDLANTFISEELDKLPTAGMAVIEIEGTGWSDLENGKVTNEWVDYPKKKS
jgi:phosphohistidine phosphatase